MGSELLCEEATNVGSVPFEIFCYGLFCELRFIVGFLLCCDFLIFFFFFWFKVLSGGGNW